MCTDIFENKRSLSSNRYIQQMQMAHKYKKLDQSERKPAPLKKSFFQKEGGSIIIKTELAKG